MRSAPHSALAIIVASSALVNAAEPVLTEKQSVKLAQIQELSDFIHSEGTTAPLVSNGKDHGLKPGTKIKYVKIKEPNGHRVCDLIYDQDAAELTRPNSLLLLDRADNGQETVFTDYRFDLKGQLMSAATSTGRKDAEGKPIKGSLKESMLDPKDERVRASANKSLHYWLSGGYKKHLAPKKGGAAPESAKKAAATAAK